MDTFKPAYELYPKGVAASLARRLPFVGGLTSLPFIAKIALLARLGVASARIIMDIPAFNKNPNYSPQEKLASFYERIFIEGGGTLVYHLGMYLGMDVAARLWERMHLRNKFAVAVDGLSKVGEKIGLRGESARALNTDLEHAFRNFYQSRPPGGANPTDGLMHLNLFAEDLYGSSGSRSHNGFLDAIHQRLTNNGLAGNKITDAMREIKRSIFPMSRSLLNGNFSVQMVGVALGCVLGGVVIQRLNDRVVRPFAMRLSGQKHNSARQDDGYQTPMVQAPQPPSQVSPISVGAFSGITVSPAHNRTQASVSTVSQPVPSPLARPMFQSMPYTLMQPSVPLWSQTAMGGR